MTPRHITLASVATIIAILAPVGSGLLAVKKYIDSEHNQSIVRTTQRELHEEEIDRRMDRIEIAIRTIASEQSARHRDLINQILAVKSQVQEVSLKQQEIHTVHHFGQVSADAPAVKPED